MATSTIYAVKFRRRNEGRTDYRKRLGLLKSNKPRLVVRLSNKYVKVQVVKSVNGHDSILASANSSELLKMGWKYSCKNLTAAYLTGLLAGSKASVKEAILDAGISKPSSRVFAALKGFVDSGKIVPHSDEVIPSEERLNGAHINEKILKDAESLKEKISKHGSKKK